MVHHRHRMPHLLALTSIGRADWVLPRFLLGGFAVALPQRYWRARPLVLMAAKGGRAQAPELASAAQVETGAANPADQVDRT